MKRKRTQLTWLILVAVLLPASVPAKNIYKYQDENGSPFGAHDPWNIEASMNSCHVVTGLLYGEGDFLKSMEIATRCGNDADCNPGTVAGILGAMKGYNWIPENFIELENAIKSGALRV